MSRQTIYKPNWYYLKKPEELGRYLVTRHALIDSDKLLIDIADRRLEKDSEGFPYECWYAHGFELTDEQIVCWAELPEVPFA